MTSSTANAHVWAPSGGGDVPFLLDRGRPQRLGGAFSVSLFSHIAAVALFLVVAHSMPDSTTAMLPDLNNYEIVWLPSPGPGGGGGGGGNNTPTPPRKAELPGKEKVTVPVTKPPEITPEAKPEDTPPVEQELTIPAKTLASSDQTLPGALVGMPSATESRGMGEGTGAGGGTGSGIGGGDGSGLGPGTGGGTGGGAYRPGNGVTLPRILRDVKPQYTADAMRAKVQGIVLLEAVVMPDGSVGRVEIVKSLDTVFGLDQEAIKAAKQWRFAPGTRLGAPVPVIVTIELTFTLR